MVSLIIRSSNFTSRYRDLKNPFTGEVTRVYQSDGLLEIHLASVKKYLKELGGYEAEAGEYVHIPWKRGEKIYVCANGLLSGGNPSSYGIEVDCLCEAFCEVIFQICFRGKMAVTLNGESFAFTSAEFPKGVELRWPNIITVKDSKEMHKFLKGS